MAVTPGLTRGDEDVAAYCPCPRRRGRWCGGCGSGADAIRTGDREAVDDAAITDSLSWSYFRSGQFVRALPLLERAAQAERGSITINEHLGDAQWRAAAVYADAAQKARIAAKLADGLE